MTIPGQPKEIEVEKDSELQERKQNRRHWLRIKFIYSGVLGVINSDFWALVIPGLDEKVALQGISKPLYVHNIIHHIGKSEHNANFHVVEIKLVDEKEELEV